MIPIIKTGIRSISHLALLIIILVFILTGNAPAVSVVKCDLVKDYNIDWKDLEVIAQHWLNTCGECSGTDLNGSGTVNLVDFALFAPHWKADPDLVYLWTFVEQQLDNSMNTFITDPCYWDANYPRSTYPQTGKWEAKAKGHWASGYWPGALWYLYQRTSDQKWKNWAHSWTVPLVNEPNRTGDHEAGFIVQRSYGLGYRITQNPAYKPKILQACTTLATYRYNSTVGCIRSWYTGSSPFTVIIDGMMVLEMMFWGSKNGGSSSWYNMAVSHANKTMANNVRPNGSVWQAVNYNTSNGAAGLKWNKQGATNNTTWSRGQAWGIAGFTIAYRETLDTNYLNTAKKCANYFIDHLPADYVPYWDFNAPDFPPGDPNSHLHKDSSAAAIAASGLLELSTFVSGADKVKFQNAALNILDSLTSPAYLADGTNSMGILLHGTGNAKNADDNAGEVDRSLIYGDHFFIEALMRYEDLFY